LRTRTNPFFFSDSLTAFTIWAKTERSLLDGAPLCLCVDFERNTGGIYNGKLTQARFTAVNTTFVYCGYDTDIVVGELCAIAQRAGWSGFTAYDPTLESTYLGPCQVYDISEKVFKRSGSQTIAERVSLVKTGTIPQEFRAFYDNAKSQGAKFYQQEFTERGGGISARVYTIAESTAAGLLLMRRAKDFLEQFTPIIQYNFHKATGPVTPLLEQLNKGRAPCTSIEAIRKAIAEDGYAITHSPGYVRDRIKNVRICMIGNNNAQPVTHANLMAAFVARGMQ